MLDLKRIYWTRQGLRLAYSAVMVWLAVAVLNALMSKTAPVTGTGPSTAGEVLGNLVNGVVAAAALPGVAAVVLGIVAAVLISRDVRRRDRCGASPASSAARAWLGPAANANWRPGSADAAPAPPSTATTSIRGPRRIHQPAELRCRLRQVQPGQTGPDPVAGAAATAGTTAAGLRHVRRFSERRRTAAAPLTAAWPNAG
nr:hypothetical protein [Arthrobacter nitrophenolicus]